MRYWNVIIWLEQNQYNSKSVTINKDVSVSINKDVSRTCFFEKTVLIHRQVPIVLALYIMLTVTQSLFP